MSVCVFNYNIYWIFIYFLYINVYKHKMCVYISSYQFILAYK